MIIRSSPMSPSMMIRSPLTSPSSPKMISPISESRAKMQPLIQKEGSVSVEKDRARIGELAGGTAAECAAVCCCCPCGLVSLLVLAVVRLPAGLFQQAIRRRRRKRKRKKAMAVATGAGVGSTDDDESVYHRRVLIDSGGVDSVPSMSPSEEEVELEKEMRARFYSAGFWRSASQRE